MKALDGAGKISPKLTVFSLQSVCPIFDTPVIAPSEARQRVLERLSKHDTSLEAGCSMDYKRKLELFMEQNISAAEKTRSAMGLDTENKSFDGSLVSERIAASISGFTARQLEVTRRFLCNQNQISAFGMCVVVDIQ
jgi:hypothetical protein